MAIGAATVTVRSRKSGRGNVRKFQAELRQMAEDIRRKHVPEALVDLALRIRSNAEANTRQRLGTEPGAPDAADHWLAGPLNAPAMDTARMAQGGEDASRALLRGFQLGEKLFVWNTVFYLYFHEVGYYDQDGGAGPKNLLRDAVAAEDGREVRV